MNPVVREVNKAEYLSTMVPPMRDVTYDLDAFGEPVDIWDYIERIDSEDAREYALVDVQHVYRNSVSTFDHALIPKSENVFLVVIIDLLKNAVHGHYILDLNVEYGVDISN